MNLDAIAKLVKEHEGSQRTAYLDTEGILTIGVGFNLEEESAKALIESMGLSFVAVCGGDCALTGEQIDFLFQGSLKTAIDDARKAVPSFDRHPDDVQAALADMSYNLGRPRLMKFAKMIAALEAAPPDYCAAAREMRKSNWFAQVPNRAGDDIALVQQFCQVES